MRNLLCLVAVALLGMWAAAPAEAGLFHKKTAEGGCYSQAYSGCYSQSYTQTVKVKRVKHRKACCTPVAECTTPAPTCGGPVVMTGPVASPQQPTSSRTAALEHLLFGATPQGPPVIMPVQPSKTSPVPSPPTKVTPQQ